MVFFGSGLHTYSGVDGLFYQLEIKTAFVELCSAEGTQHNRNLVLVRWHLRISVHSVIRSMTAKLKQPFCITFAYISMHAV